MLKIVELLDRAKAMNGGCSDYRLAKLLQVPQATLSSYRVAKAKPANPVAARLGTLCGLDPEAVVCWVQIDWAKTPDERDFWLGLLARLDDSAMGALDPLPRQNVAVYKSGQKVGKPRHA